MEDLFQGKYKLTLNGGILFLGTSTVQSSEPHANICLHSIIVLCTGTSLYTTAERHSHVG